MQRGHPTDLGTARVDHRQTDQVVGVPPVLVLLRLGGGGEQPGAAQLLGGGAVGRLLERQQLDAVVHARRAQGERAPLGRLGRERGARHEPLLRRVGVQLHRHLTLEPVRLADARDHHVRHGAHPGRSADMAPRAARRTYAREA
ncbi:hypothetical protein GCM10025872_23200 [Barrientosiimonas endolithica]|uniref:Uncharacterized protein n=1 Tax=Barrientosiimonas endolithica TaxID=1535208 RepID=A0ABN6YMU0_9MICO|nr:hypothetical protein GCM10025872_23200 [Barrientosiimonas endolithica]